MSDIRKLWRKTVAPFESECIDQTKVKPEVVDEFFNNGKMPDNSSFKCFLQCSGSKVLVFNSKGEVDAIEESHVFAHIDVALVQKCADKVESSDRCQRAYVLVKCLHDEVSERFSF